MNQQTTVLQPKKTSMMKLSVLSIFLTIAVLSGGNLQLEALPVSNTEELDLDQEALGERLADIPLSSAASRIILVADSKMLRGLKFLGRNQLSLPERFLSADRRDVSQDHSPSGTVKKDTMRCMVGRVYRPCWEV
ncbi:pro-melanin-concentrating hormone, like [Brachyhypopomus gauderio]|uniref:pro-melanin-concentrating hormone, like n=1 Tax=Brachyhypopomus gauderio TaxID=698409 RepID=UPI004043943A